jgi:tetratricopeptide (TPR) repeat protein
MLASSFIVLFSIPQTDSAQGASEDELLQQGYTQYLEEAEELEAILAESPDNRTLKINTADAWMNVYNYANVLGLPMEDALAKCLLYYSELLAEESDDLIRLKLAYAAFDSQDYALAEEQVTILLATDPDNVDVLTLSGGLLFYAKMDYAGAAETWRRAMELSEDETQKAALLSNIESAETAYAAGAGILTPDETTAEAEEESTDNPENANNQE